MSCRLRFAALCDHAHATPEGRIDLHGVFHDLAAPGFPAQQDALVLVAILEWGRENRGRYRFRADLLDPRERTCLTVEGETEVGAAPAGFPPSRSHLIMPLEGVIFPLPGQYTFAIKVEGQTLEGPGVFLMEAEPDQIGAPVEADRRNQPDLPKGQPDAKTP